MLYIFIMSDIRLLSSERVITDETEASFKAAGYHKIDTPEKAVNAVRELVDDEEFEEILNDLALTELKELAI